MLKEPKIVICPNPKCKTVFGNLLLILDKSKNPTEKYYGCPNCFFKVELSETVSLNEIGKNETKKPSSHNCTKYFGYLASNYTKSIIPIECLSCEKMVECVKDSN
ncbi:MAG: hypothetical protein P8Y18_06950 [Candidatus Bathyarchaeota archaeon]